MSELENTHHSKIMASIRQKYKDMPDSMIVINISEVEDDAKTIEDTSCY